jgi:pyrroloquinoline quinone biosynthesis protein A
MLKIKRPKNHDFPYIHNKSVSAIFSYPGFPETSTRRFIMAWTKPAATEMRFGFEVTMYVMNK